MIKIDSENVFGGSPAELKYKSWERENIVKTFPGIDGELIIDLGKRSRLIVQTGRLRAGNQSEIKQMITNIENLIDGSTHTLTDNYSNSYNNIIIENFELTSAIQAGPTFFCDYKITYRQLP